MMAGSLRALVKPRAASPVTGDPLPLEDAILPVVDSLATSIVVIVGGPGSGKSTALEYLKAVMPPDARTQFLDDASAGEVARAAAAGRVVCTASSSNRIVGDLTVALLPWGDDELIEYLLAAHPEQCGSVMARVRSDAQRHLLSGWPRLWCLVLDQMAGDRSFVQVKQALRAKVDSLLHDDELRMAAQWFSLERVVKFDQVAGKEYQKLIPHDDNAELLGLLRYNVVRSFLAAERIATELRSERGRDLLSRQLPKAIVVEVAHVVSGDRRVLDYLSRLTLEKDRQCHAMAASILHNLDKAWKPNPARVPCLRGAYLANAQWRGVDLSEADLVGTDLSDADLRDAILAKARAFGVKLHAAELCGALLGRIVAEVADFSAADLSGARACEANFMGSDLQSANLESADLRDAKLSACNLHCTNFRGANLKGAELVAAVIDQADFSNADLTDANLDESTLGRAASFSGARFSGAHMVSCNLEYMELPNAEFRGARLDRSVLTGSQMRGADFRGASLRETGLAEIDWEGVDLRDADMREATFHMGSSRSGLVDSPIASEGTRTGFYTDDYDDQNYKSPEEIRKANLRGADLRGAHIERVDFYLVDLREAKYDAGQEQHLRRCGAILETRE